MKKAAPWVLLGVVMVALVGWPEVFPESWVTLWNISGNVTAAAATGDGRVVLFESIERRSKKGASYSITRIHVRDAATGKAVLAPWFGPKQKWLGLSGDLVLTELPSGAVEGRSTKTGEVKLTMEQLAAVVPGLDAKTARFELQHDGRLACTTTQGRSVRVDPAGPRVVDEPLRPQGGYARPSLRTVPGGERSSPTGGEPSYLRAQWLDGWDTGRPLEAARGWLARHVDQLGRPEGEGVIVSAIDAAGTEVWRHPIENARLMGVVRPGGDVLVLLLTAKGADWAAEGLDAATGATRWTAAP